jgi:hypothetical protein
VDNVWEYLYRIIFSDIYGENNLTRDQFNLPINILPRHVVSTTEFGTVPRCVVKIKLETPEDAEETGSPTVWYDTRYDIRYNVIPQGQIVGTLSSRYYFDPLKVENGPPIGFAGSINNQRPIAPDSIIYKDTGHIQRFGFIPNIFLNPGVPLNYTSTFETPPSGIFPELDTTPAVNEFADQWYGPVPWTINENIKRGGSWLALNNPYILSLELTNQGTGSGPFARRLFKPLSIMGQTNHSPNIIPTTKGETRSGSSLTGPLRHWINSFEAVIIGGDPNTKIDDISWYYKSCGGSPCNNDGILLSTSPEKSLTTFSAISDFGGTSKNGLPQFNAVYQLMCGPVPTVSHGPLFVESDDYNTTDLNFIMAGPTIKINDRINNPITIGPGLIPGDSTESQILLIPDGRVLSFYALTEDPGTWGRGPNPQARLDRFLKFTTNWEHLDYDVWIELRGENGSRYTTVIPAGQTTAYSKCPFGPSYNFLVPENQKTWTIQFAKWKPNSSSTIVSGNFDYVLTGEAHSISIDIMSYLP